MFIKKTVAAVLVISAATCFHNFLFTLSADILVPTRSVLPSWPMYAFFLAIAVGGIYGGAKLWKRWMVLFGIWLIVVAAGTLEAMLSGGESAPQPAGAERLSGYVAEGLVLACAVLMLVLAVRQWRAASGTRAGLLDIVLAGSVENGVLRAARKAFAAQDQARAVELCTELIERDPNLLQAYLLRASSYMLMPKEQQKALADLDRLLQLAPPEAHAAEAGHLQRAALHFELKNYREAVADLSRAIEMGNKDPMVFMNRGLAHLRMKEFPAARPDLDRAVALAPREAMVYNARAGVHMGMKNWAAARADLNRALELRPDYDLAILNRGSLAIQEGRLEEGCGWLRRAFKLSRRCLDHARSDEDLDSVRDRPEFQALMAELDGTEPSIPQFGAGPEAPDPYEPLAAIYDEWHERRGVYCWLPRVETHLARYGRGDETSSCLDLACGTGTLLVALRARHPSWRLVGIDASAAMLREAGRKPSADTIQWIRGAFDQAPAVGAFDVVTCFDAAFGYAQTLPELAAAFRHACAALEPGGLLIFDLDNRRGCEHDSEGRGRVAGPGWEVVTRCEFDAAIGRKTISVAVERAGANEVVRTALVVTCFARDDIIQALADSGFAVEAAEGWSFAPHAVAGKTWFVARKLASPTTKGLARRVT